MIEFEDGRKMKIPTGDDKKNARMSLAKKLLSSNIPNFKCANKKVSIKFYKGDVCYYTLLYYFIHFSIFHLRSIGIY